MTAGIWKTMPRATMMLKNKSKYSTASMIGVRCEATIQSRRKRRAVGNAM